MILDWKRVLAGALTGLLAAVVVDVDAWAKAPAEEPFDWGLAFKRWVSGAVVGAAAGAGLQVAG